MCTMLDHLLYMHSAGSSGICGQYWFICYNLHNTGSSATTCTILVHLQQGAQCRFTCYNMHNAGSYATKHSMLVHLLNVRSGSVARYYFQHVLINYTCMYTPVLSLYKVLYLYKVLNLLQGTTPVQGTKPAARH